MSQAPEETRVLVRSPGSLRTGWAVFPPGHLHPIYTESSSCRAQWGRDPWVTLTVRITSHSTVRSPLEQRVVNRFFLCETSALASVRIITTTQQEY
jgi:hypothetical protein